MVKGLWRRARKIVRAWWRDWVLNESPPDEAAARKRTGQAARERLRDRASRAIALAEAAHGDLTRQATQQRMMAIGAQGLVGSNEGEARNILSQMIDTETRLLHLAVHYRWLQREAERHAATWLVARDAEDMGSVGELEELTPGNEAGLLTESGTTERMQFDGGVLAAIAEIDAGARQNQVEQALARLKSGMSKLTSFTVTEDLSLAEIDELIAQPCFSGFNLIG